MRPAHSPIPRATPIPRLQRGTSPSPILRLRPVAALRSPATARLGRAARSTSSSGSRRWAPRRGRCPKGSPRWMCSSSEVAAVVEVAIVVVAAVEALRTSLASPSVRERVTASPSVPVVMAVLRQRAVTGPPAIRRVSSRVVMALPQMAARAATTPRVVQAARRRDQDQRMERWSR